MDENDFIMLISMVLLQITNISNVSITQTSVAPITDGNKSIDV